jgi:peptidoglycan/LPS O-acetylase OafA/YrhL
MSHVIGQPAERSFRFDVQFLRGVAVLVVVVFHAAADILPKGLLGVDVFFVISGYLMTGMILRELDHGRFDFRRFYYRRARRLLPACYSTLVATTIVGYLAMTSEQRSEYLTQLIGALTFSANFVLAEQGGYFAGDAHNRPLLHIWSLSLEEQYYFLLPAALALVAARYRGPLLWAAAALSLAACMWLISGYAIPGLDISLDYRQRFAFYMLPTRAWELILGSICGLVMLRRPDLSPPPWAKYPALAAVIFVCAVGLDDAHPRGDAMLAVAACCVLLLGNDQWLPRVAFTRAVAAVGDWSYSLYLLHWPILCFVALAYGQAVPASVTWLAVALAIGLAFLQYRFVEMPFRRAGWTLRRGAEWRWAGTAVLVASAAAPAAYAASANPSPFGEILKDNIGLSPRCSQQDSWEDIAACRTSDEPILAVWGDSLAIHLIPGLAAQGIDLVQITKTSCAPIDGVSAVGPNQSPPEADECQRFNADALKKLMSHPSVRYVLIASTYRPLRPGSELLVDRVRQPWSQVARQRFVATIKQLQAAGKVPVLMATLPDVGFDPAMCNVRELERLPVFGRPSCSPAPVQQVSDWQATLTLLEGISRETGVRLYNPATVLCDRGLCQTRVGSNLIYRDRLHMTKWGSVYVISRLGIARKHDPALRGAGAASSKQAATMSYTSQN